MRPRVASLVSFVGVFALSICAGLAARRAKAQAAQNSTPTMVYLHGRIYTNDPSNPWAEAMSVRNGKITCVGKIAHILLDCGGNDPNAETIELKGKFLMPGFNDAHVHLGGAGADMLSVRLNGVTSIGELQKRLAEAVAHHKEGEWITGSGWDHTLWPDRKFPNKEELDAVSPKNPVFLVHISGHVAVANSLALEHGEIQDASPNPPGGVIERDANGEATGMLEESSAMNLVSVRIPDPSPEERRRGIELALADAAKNGVTSVQDFSDWADFLIYTQLKDEGKLTLRITEWLPFLLPLDRLQDMRAEGGTTDPWLKTGALKAYVDGALGSRTAALLAPYSDDPSTGGILTNDPEKLRTMAIERDKAHFQLAFHAIGDRANRIALDVFEAVAKANGPRDRRDRVEHAQVLAPEDLPRFAKLHVIASMQPSHETTDMRWAGSRIGPDRAKGAYAWASLLKSGAHLAFGTDYDVEPINPVRGLYACVTREFPEGGPPGGWQGQERISLEDCIRAYTSGSAYAEFEEGKKGELTPGEYADYIILSDDLTKIPPAQYLKVRVLRTVVGGRVVYSAENSDLDGP
ncbi:MAG TPA: amidohydrolase [Candidatus Methylomirabilis sp.]|nr:amidohydrolase [Candidatus Methylomirabilis sp.]